MTLRRFLTRLIWLCVLPPLLLAAALAVDHVLDQGDRDSQAAERLAQELAAALTADLSERLGALQLLARSPLIDDSAHWESFRSEALRMGELYGLEVLLVDRAPKLRLHARTPVGRPLPPLQADAAVRRVFDGALQAVASTVIGASESGEYRVSLAVPVLRAEQPTTYLLLGILPDSGLRRALAAHALPSGWGITLRDDMNQTLARFGGPSNEAVGKRPYTVRIGNAPWSLTLEVPAMDHRARLWRHGTWMLLALALATAIAVAAGIWGSQRLKRDLRALTDPQAKALPAIAEVATVHTRLADAAMQVGLREAQLRAILDSASEGVIACDQEQRILFVNPAALRMFGYGDAALLGQPLDRLIPERLREQHRQHVRRFGEAGEGVRHLGSVMLISALHADGHEFPVDASISHVKVNGHEYYTAMVRDVSERLRMLTELEVSHRELQRLLAEQHKVQETERLRIASELHDDLQQTLAAILIEGAALRQLTGTQPALTEPLQRIDSLASAAIASTRRIVNDLRPQMLDELGLVAALQALARRFEQRSGVPCHFESVGLPAGGIAPLPAVATCLYRVMQEALNNVAKHARASQVRVSLELRPGQRLLLRVVDNGQGLREEDRRKEDSFGLLSLRERARAVGGTVHVAGVPGAGTTVEVEVPLLADSTKADQANRRRRDDCKP